MRLRLAGKKQRWLKEMQEKERPMGGIFPGVTRLVPSYCFPPWESVQIEQGATQAAQSAPILLPSFLNKRSLQSKALEAGHLSPFGGAGVVIEKMQ